MFRGILFLAPLLAATSVGFAQDASVWIGHKVVKFAQTPLRIKDQVVNEKGLFRTYKVERANGGWLWLEDGDIRGWVPTNQVIQYEQALSYLDHVLRIDPNASWALLTRASMWGERKDYGKAEVDYSSYLRLQPDEPSGYVGRGVARFNQAKYTEAVADLTSAIQQPRKSSEAELARYYRALALGHLNRDDDAIADFDEILRENPENVATLYQRAKLHHFRGEYAKAKADFSEGIRLRPDKVWGYLGRGQILLIEKEYFRAITNLDEAVRLKPRNVDARETRGCLFLRIRDFERAMADFTIAIEESAGDPHRKALNLYNRSLAELQLRKFDEVIVDCTEAIQLDPDCLPDKEPDSSKTVGGSVEDRRFATRGLAYLMKKEYANAVADLDQAILIKPLKANHHALRGVVHLAWKQYDDALTDLNEAIRLDPDTIPPYVNRGKVRMAQRDYEKAREEFEAVATKAPQDPSVLQARASLLSACPDSRFRDGKTAVEFAERAYELGDKKEAVLLETLATAYAEQGDFDKAVQWQERAIERAKADSCFDIESFQKRLDLFRQHLPFRYVEATRSE